MSGKAAGKSRAHSVMMRPSRGSSSPVGSVTSPMPYRSESAGIAVVNSMYWSLNRNLGGGEEVGLRACVRQDRATALRRNPCGWGMMSGTAASST
jgi:hypothetical protein